MGNLQVKPITEQRALEREKIRHAFLRLTGSVLTEPMIDGSIPVKPVDILGEHGLTVPKPEMEKILEIMKKRNSGEIKFGDADKRILLILGRLVKQKQ